MLAASVFFSSNWAVRDGTAGVEGADPEEKTLAAVMAAAGDG